MPGISVEELLEHGGWARRLAAALIADPHAADDLVQETWVAALSRPPSEAGAARAWIGRVMRNLASNRRRDEARRSVREASVARGELQPSSADVAQELEMHRALVDALASIDVDQARTVVRRYFHGLSSAEIAREERVPESTVRNRLMRGLDALRAKLEAKYGDRSTWAALLLPLARGKGAGAATATVAGGLLVTSAIGKVCVAGIVLGLGALGLWAWTGARRSGSAPLAVEASSPRSLESPAIVDGSAGQNASRTAIPTATTDAAPATTAAKPDPSAWIEARIVEPGGAPIAGAELVVVDRLDLGQIEASAAPRATSAADGWLRLEVRKSDRSRNRGTASRVTWTLAIRIGAPGRESREDSPTMTPGQTTSLGELTLRPGGILRGRVVLGTSPRNKSWVKIITPELTLDERARMRIDGIGYERKDCGRPLLREDGTYESVGIPVGTYRVVTDARTPGYFFACSEPIEVHAGEITQVPDLVPESNPNVISGRIVRSDGTAALGRELSYKFRRIDGGSPIPTPVGVSVDTKTGEFQLDCPSEGACDLFVLDTGDDGGEAVMHDVPTGTHDVVLKVVPSAHIDLLVRDESGAPILDYHVASKSEGFSYSSAGPRPEGRMSVIVHAVPFHLDVSATGFAAQTFGPFDLGRFPPELSVTLRAIPAIHGRVVHRGAPVSSSTVALRHVAPPDRMVSLNGFPCRFDQELAPITSTDKEGRFTFAARDPGTFALIATHPNYAEAESPPFDHSPSEESPEFVLEMSDGGVLEGRVITPEGESAAGTIVGISRGAVTSRTTFVAPDGSYRFDKLAPGSWSIRRCERDFTGGGSSTLAYVGGFDPSLAACEIEEARTTRFDLDLRQASCTLRGQFRFAVTSGSSWAARLVPDGELESLTTHALLGSKGELRMTANVLGPHTLILASSGDEHRDQKIEERIVLHRGSNEWNLDLLGGSVEGESLPDSLLVHEWRNDRGTTCTTHFLSDAKGSFHVDGIPAGTGTVELLRDGRRLLGVDIEVRPGETTHLTLR